jgi:hypothetical protein
MMNELMQVPSHLQRQDRDWNALMERYPLLGGYENERQNIQDMLRPAYEDYTKRYSSSLITLSLNRSAFLYFLATQLNARVIHDLGSGFSSYVFRLNPKQGERQVISVDDSSYWIGRTQLFLRDHRMDADGMKTLEIYRAEDLPHGFDLCLLDIGDYKLRENLLPALLPSVQSNDGKIFIDDFHDPQYRKFVTSLCEERSLRVYSLRKVTRRRLSHAALVCR